MKSARVSHSTSAGPTALHVASRVSASVLGSYVFVWGFVSLGVALGVAAGMPYADAQTLLYLLAFWVLLVAFCWAFIARRLAVVWATLAGGGALMTGGAWLLSRALL